MKNNKSKVFLIILISIMLINSAALIISWRIWLKYDNLVNSVDFIDRATVSLHDAYMLLVRHELLQNVMKYSGISLVSFVFILLCFIIVRRLIIK